MRKGGLMLSEKNIVLGVTGSIAAFRALDLASKLTQAGAKVDVVMTKAATEFVTALSFRSLTHRQVFGDMFQPVSELSLEHIALADRAQAVVIAPATANTIAKLASGIADELLTSVVLATHAPVIVAPAMDSGMYDNAATQENLAKLEARGMTIVGPGSGHLASGAMGKGRLSDVEDIIGTIRTVLGRNGPLAGRKFVVSAGGTQEPIDPVRHIGNRSSGKMGYAVAEAARDRGARVVLVTCPTALRPPVGMEIVPVRTALEMRDAVWGACEDADVLIMTAAVGDYRPVSVAEQKIKKAKSETLTIELVRNPDILKGAKGKGRLIKIGFAAETEKLLEHAREELEEKGVDLVAANDVTAADSGFATDTNRVVFLDRQGGTETLPLMLKSQVAERLMDRITAILAKRT